MSHVPAHPRGQKRIGHKHGGAPATISSRVRRLTSTYPVRSITRNIAYESVFERSIYDGALTAFVDKNHSGLDRSHARMLRLVYDLNKGLHTDAITQKQKGMWEITATYSFRLQSLLGSGS